MNVEKLPLFSPVDFGNVRDPTRPILCFPWESDSPHRVSSHSHTRGHIVLLEAGTYWVLTPEGTWLATSGQAIWVPPHAQHEVHSHCPVRAHVLFVDEAHSASLPARCGTAQVTPLLFELIRRMGLHGNDYGHGSPAARLALVTLDELAGMEFAPVTLPVSNELRLARAMRIVIEDPMSHTELDQLARAAGASKRTMSRLFAKELGMTFRQWRTRVILTKAIERLERGAAVTEVASELGYTPSSFAFMFRSNLGISPRRFCARDRRR